MACAETLPTHHATHRLAEISSARHLTFMTKKIGICCICGQQGSLSFEHVPPQAAYNNHRVFEANVKRMIGGSWQALKNPSGRFNQKGAGRHTLCEPCNNKTGHWYGPAFIEWAQQGMRLLSASRGDLSLLCPFRIYPLRVVKQIASMFFSACGSEFHKVHPDLVRFVLNKEILHVPENIRFYSFFHRPTEATVSRQSGITGVLDRGRQHVFSEIVFPPYGFIMSVDSAPINNRLCDITHFGEFGYVCKDTRYLRQPVLPVVSWLPADFRDESEIKRAFDNAPES